MVPGERPETWVTGRTGHIGNTFPPLGAGGGDAVEGVFGDGRAPAVCRQVVQRRIDDRRTWRALERPASGSIGTGWRVVVECLSAHVTPRLGGTSRSILTAP